MYTFAERLKELREEKNLTQKQIADIAGVTLSAVSLWEKKKHPPTVDKVILLARYFGVTVGYIVGVED